MEAGLFDEVRKLAGMGYRKAMLSMQGIGYRQVLNISADLRRRQKQSVLSNGIPAGMQSGR